MYTLENVSTAPSYPALKRRGFTDAQTVEYYKCSNSSDRTKMFNRITNSQNTSTQKCTVDIDSVRDMALDYIDRTWTYRGRDFKLTDMGWKFRFNDRKSANGVCSPRTRTIYLSSYIVESSTREMSGWINTMVHEIAHAINHHLGSRGHDWQWRNIFLSFGGTGDTCSKDVTYDNLLENPVSKYTTICPNGHTHPSHRYSRAIADGRRSCGKCSDTFDKRYLLKQIKN